MRKQIYLGLSLILFGISTFAQAPVLYLTNGDHLFRLKKQISTGNTEATVLYKSILSKADQFLTMKPVSVMEKSFTPKSGNKHDYMSQAPYFWYDSTKVNGLPYKRKDGERNPEIEKITDRKNIGKLEAAIRSLSVAYYLSGNEKYASKSLSLLKTWFIDADTRMNPNLDYAQGVPGVNDGRGIGIIETLALAGIADGVQLLLPSKNIPAESIISIKKWYSDYLIWMQTSKNGIDEHNSKNNHGTFYDMQILDFALFTGQTEFAKNYIKTTLKRMEIQLEVDGKQPLELERTQAMHYSAFNLDAWFKVANIAEKINVDLWNYKSADGKGIKAALDWLIPYTLGEKKWAYQQITPFDKKEMYSLMLQAYSHYKTDNYKTISMQLKPSNTDPFIEALYGI